MTRGLDEDRIESREEAAPIGQTDQGIRVRQTVEFSQSQLASRELSNQALNLVEKHYRVS
jgi:hypothetical protein